MVPARTTRRGSLWIVHVSFLYYYDRAAFAMMVELMIVSMLVLIVMMAITMQWK